MKSNDPYYQSKYWKQYRATLLDDPDCKCSMCNKPKFYIMKRSQEVRKHKGFTVHHLHYNNINEEDETSTVVLCYSCHRILHDILNRKTESNTVLDKLQFIIKSEIYKYS